MLHSAKRDLEIRSDAHTFFEVIWDFERYPEFITGIDAVRLLERPSANGTGPRILARFDASLLGVPFSYVVECERDGDRRVHWKRTAGSFRAARGSWTLVESGKGKIRVHYENAVDPGFGVPAFAVKWVHERTLPLLLDEIRARVESRARSRSSGRQPHAGDR